MFNHVGVAVDSVDRAVDWYGKHFGFRKLRSDNVADRSVDQGEAPVYKIYGNKLNKVKVAFLTTGNGVGFEIFEFTDPPTKSATEVNKNWTLEEQYQKGGFFHIAITAPDPDTVCQRACEDGAIKIGETITMYDNEKTL